MTEPNPKNIPTWDQSVKEAEKREEQELQENDEPKTDVDKLLDERKHGEPQEPPDYDQL